MTEEMIRRKVKFFFDNKKSIHIQFKKGNWKNGEILEISSDFFMLQEFLEGKQPIFFQQIEDVDVYTIKKEFRKDGRN